MSSTVPIAINQRLWRLEKPLEEVREKVRRLEEDERTLTWMQKVDDSRMRRVERMVSDLEPQGRVRRMLMRLIGVTRQDMVRDIAGFLSSNVVSRAHRYKCGRTLIKYCFFSIPMCLRKDLKTPLETGSRLGRVKVWRSGPVHF